MASSSTAAPSPTEIVPGTMYSLPEIKARLGWGDHAMRTARRNGLKVQYVAGRGYVYGKDAIDYIRQRGKVSLR